MCPWHGLLYPRALRHFDITLHASDWPVYLAQYTDAIPDSTISRSSAATLPRQAVDAGPLVSYDSSSEEEEELPNPNGVELVQKRPSAPEPVAPSAKRKRDLPKLPTTFSTTNPRDDPAQHQGRTRSRPFVDGDYNAHIYISLPLPVILRRTIEEINELARELCPGYDIHSLVSGPSAHPPSAGAAKNPARPAKIELPLHISLTHPLPLRHSQLLQFRDDVRAALRAGGGGGGIGNGLRLSLAGDVVAFVNGRKHGGEGQGGRTFLALRVTAGSKDIERIVTAAIHPILAKLHLPLYHSNPTFHASFAWTLIGSLQNSRAGAGLSSDDDCGDGTAEAYASSEAGQTPFTPEILGAISAKFSKVLIDAQPRGGWEVQDLELKIGKEIFQISIA